MYNQGTQGSNGPEQFQSGQDQVLPEARLFAGNHGKANPVLGQVTPGSDMNDGSGDDDSSTNDGPDRNMAFKTTPVPTIGRSNEQGKMADDRNAMFDGSGESRSYAWKQGETPDTSTDGFKAGSKGSGGISR